MSGALKKTTGLTGLAVARDPHKSLTVLYEKLLDILSRMPETAGYRKNTEVLVRDRLAILKSERKVEKFEEKINCGQAEELVIQAERELTLARKMLEWKPWDKPTKEIPHNQWKWPL